MIEFSDEIDIDASAAKIWSILTDASGYANWNPEVTGIEGTFSNGATLTLYRASAPEKSTVEITVFDAPRKLTMTSSGGMPTMLLQAQRTFVLSPLSESTVRVSQRLEFIGIISRMVLNSIPDQKPIIEQVGHALKRAAEQ